MILAISTTRNLQAMDRAHRLGQRKVVTVYRLLMKATLEERIMSLQQFKKDVANAVVNADNVAADTMDTGGVMDLMAGAAAGGSARGASAAQDAATDEGEGEDAAVQAFLQRAHGAKDDLQPCDDAVWRCIGRHWCSTK
jgi:hypothetical protein